MYNKADFIRFFREVGWIQFVAPLVFYVVYIAIAYEEDHLRGLDDVNSAMWPFISSLFLFLTPFVFGTRFIRSDLDNQSWHYIKLSSYSPVSTFFSRYGIIITLALPTLICNIAWLFIIHKMPILSILSYVVWCFLILFILYSIMMILSMGAIARGYQRFSGMFISLLCGFGGIALYSMILGPIISSKYVEMILSFPGVSFIGLDNLNIFIVLSLFFVPYAVFAGMAALLVFHREENYRYNHLYFAVPFMLMAVWYFGFSFSEGSLLYQIMSFDTKHFLPGADISLEMSRVAWFAHAYISLYVLAGLSYFLFLVERKDMDIIKKLVNAYQNHGLMGVLKIMPLWIYNTLFVFLMACFYYLYGQSYFEVYDEKYGHFFAFFFVFLCIFVVRDMMLALLFFGFPKQAKQNNSMNYYGVLFFWAVYFMGWILDHVPLIGRHLNFFGLLKRWGGDGGIITADLMILVVINVIIGIALASKIRKRWKQLYA